MPNPKASESEVLAAIVNYCQAERIFVRRQNTGALKAQYKGKDRFIRFSEPGASDLWLILPGGRYGAVECKKEGWKPPKAGTKAFEHWNRQLLWQEQIRNAGGLAFFASSLDEFIRGIRG